MPPQKIFKLQAHNMAFSIILIVNTFVWLSGASKFLREIAEVAAFSDYYAFILWSVNFSGAVASILIGTFIVGRFRRRICFLLFWVLFGIASSLAPLFLDITTVNGAVMVSILFSISLGLGLSTCMMKFADSTTVENRARFGGITLIILMGLGAFIANIITEDMLINSLTLAFWRGLGLVAFFFINLNEKVNERKVNISFKSVLTERSFILYMLPWMMFSLVNHLSAAISANIHSKEFMYFSLITGNVLAGVFAVVGGFLSDIIGRKRVTLFGFIMLGFGYAVLGIQPQNLLSGYFYMVVDGVAWGIFYVLFIFTIWGDLAYDKSSEKFYALGSLPYLLSNFLRLTLGPSIANTVSPFAVFSFAAFFLFLAVLPLMFAPETLPEKKIRERELKRYIEKAKKIKEKYV